MTQSRSVLPKDDTMNRQSDERRGPGILLALVLLVCCALPFLLVSGASLAFIRPYWPLVGALVAVAGVVGFVWYLMRGWPKRPRNGREKLE
jgi:membrane associated rhomboid family serine protease